MRTKEVVTINDMTAALVLLDKGECFLYSWHTSRNAARQAKYYRSQTEPDLFLIIMDAEDVYRVLPHA